MNHINDLMSAYLDNELSYDERKKVEEHINHCSECYGLYENLSLMNNNLTETFQSIEPPKGFEKRVMEEINHSMIIAYQARAQVTSLGVLASSLVLVLLYLKYNPFIFLGFKLTSTMTDIALRVFQTVTVIFSDLPFAIGGLIIFSVILLSIAGWSLRHLLTSKTTVLGE